MKFIQYTMSDLNCSIHLWLRFDSSILGKYLKIVAVCIASVRLTHSIVAPQKHRTYAHCSTNICQPVSHLDDCERKHEENKVSSKFYDFVSLHSFSTENTVTLYFVEVVVPVATCESSVGHALPA